jgi:hypothetical protein
VIQTVTGQQRDVTLRWAVAPGYEKSHARVLVSLVDITERKQREGANLFVADVLFPANQKYTNCMRPSAGQALQLALFFT